MQAQSLQLALWHMWIPNRHSKMVWIYIGKKSPVSRPAQFKPVLFKSHLYLEEVIA